MIGRFVATGALPGDDRVQRLVDDVHARWRDERGGACSTVYPALAAADPDRFGLSLAAVSGVVAWAGDHDVPFPIMSVVKPFVLALVVDRVGVEVIRSEVGLDATGGRFNEVGSLERTGGLSNPMVNAGALATIARFGDPGADVEARWDELRDRLGAFAGHPLPVDEEVLASARATNRRNRSIALLLGDLGVIPGEPSDVVELYTRACCLAVSTDDLAALGAVLADGGVHPVTGEQVVSADACRQVLAVMATAGMYETSGQWLVDVGLPGKSGIAGGILTIAPGKGGLAAWSPPLDPAGNSVRGQRATADLSRALGLDLFASQPDR
ncbi:MAG: glutaminase A [Acidimicrobiales bacterium]|nr:glutaminase A [Acidimicrobiales bacterium]